MKKCIVHTKVCQKAPLSSRVEATSNSDEKIKLIGLAIIVTPSVSQSVEILLNKKIKFCSNLLKAFQDDLKACLVHEPCPLLCGLYYEPLL